MKSLLNIFHTAATRNTPTAAMLYRFFGPILSNTSHATQIPKYTSTVKATAHSNM